MGKRTWKLTEDLKPYIVVRLACYDSMSAIAKSLREDHGIEITRQAIERYNPLRYAGRRCSEQWATLFFETRRKLVEGRADIGVAHKMVRVRWLDQMAHREMTEGNTAEARALLKQAAEEMNDGVARRHEHHGPVVHANLSAAELDARLTAASDRLAAAMAARRLGAPSAGTGNGGRALAGPDGERGSVQPAGEPVSG